MAVSTRPSRFSRGNEAGVATTMGLVLMMLSVFAMVSGVLVVQVVATHRAAQNAADLAALGGAAQIQEGGVPCPTAARVATRNQVRLVQCEQRADEVHVEVIAEGRGIADLLPSMRARAKAGPVRSGDQSAGGASSP